VSQLDIPLSRPFRRSIDPTLSPGSCRDDSYVTVQRGCHRRVGGGVSSLVSLVRCLPRELEAAVAVALHVPEESR